MLRHRIICFVLMTAASLCILMLIDAMNAASAPAKGVAKEIVNSIGMKLVRIPAGTFKMGSTKAEQDAVIAEVE
jgi:formylglycine-generating enzyme required for sulfatase activity